MIAGLTPMSTARGIERSPSIDLVVELLVEGRTERSFRREKFLPDPPGGTIVDAAVHDGAALRYERGLNYLFFDG